MSTKRKIRFIDPQGNPARPLNAFIKRWPLLGPIILATICDKRGYDSQVYSENFSGPIEENAQAYRDLCSADVVAITIMTSTAFRGYTIADRIRRDAPGVRIAIGGVHATFMPEEALAHADIVCKGEGENVIERIASGEIASGIIDAAPVTDLDALPTPDHFLMRDFDKLIASCHKRELYELPVLISRGCPQGCTFCSVSRMFGRKVRRQSPEKVYRDLAHYVAQGFRFIFFYDDNFVSDREWARAVLERIRPLRVRFNAQVRVDFSWIDAKRTRRDHDLLRAMRRSGCTGLIMGYETLDDDTASGWNKGYQGCRDGDSLETRMYEDTRILHENGIWSYGMFMLGPQHTRRTADRILRFARRSQLHSLQVTILTPFPGTPLMDEMRPHLILNRFPEDWDYYDVVHCVFDHARIGVEGLQRLVLDMHKRYYRFGGWNARSIRTISRRPIAFTDKLMDLVTRVKIARGIFTRWGKEIDDYLDMVKRREENGDIPHFPQ